MHPAMIQAALKVRSVSQADIARRCRVTHTGVYQVIQGRARSSKIEECIAELTGLTLAELWPQWHGKASNKPAREQVLESLRITGLRAAS
jgi:lambda repressor-like predicted transcriptional regulator